MWESQQTSVSSSKPSDRSFNKDPTCMHHKEQHVLYISISSTKAILLPSWTIIISLTERCLCFSELGLNFHQYFMIESGFVEKIFACLDVFVKLLGKFFCLYSRDALPVLPFWCSFRASCSAKSYILSSYITEVLQVFQSSHLCSFFVRLPPFVLCLGRKLMFEKILRISLFRKGGKTS